MLKVPDQSKECAESGFGITQRTAGQRKGGWYPRRRRDQEGRAERRNKV